jgi:hypothetical protein
MVHSGYFTINPDSLNLAANNYIGGSSRIRHEKLGNGRIYWHLVGKNTTDDDNIM